MTSRNLSSALLVLAAVSLISGIVPPVASGTSHVSEVIARIGSLGKKEREAFLVEGAKKEGAITIYGSHEVSQFNEMIRAFNSRYPFIKGEFFRASRNRLVSKIIMEWRAKQYSVDIINSVVHFGFDLFDHKGLLQPYLSPERIHYDPVYYGKDGSWYTYRTLIGGLVYNTKLVKPDQVPKTYEDLLHPRWKGKLTFDTGAEYLLAAFEHAWGKGKTVEYARKLAAQQPIFHSNRTLETNLVVAGEYPIAIDINVDTTVQIRDKGAPIGITLLRPYVSKPHGLFLARNTPHAHAAILFHDWLLSADGQTFLGKNLGATIARKDVPVRYPEFQIDPDFVLIPENYANHEAKERYTREFREIFGLPN